MTITTKSMLDELIIMGKNKIDKEFKDFIDLNYSKDEIDTYNLSQMGLMEVKRFVLRYWIKLNIWNNENIKIIHKALYRYSKTLLS